MPAEPRDESAPLGDEPSSALRRAYTAFPHQTAELLEQLRRPAQSTDNLLDVLDRACRQAVRLIGDAHWAGVSAHFDRAPFTAAYTEQQVLVVDEGQYEQGDGPCMEAVRTDRQVAMTLEEVSALWPHLTAAAADAGVRSFLAMPLHAGGGPVGSLNLYSTHPGGLRLPDPDLLDVLTELIDSALQDYLSIQPLQTRAEQLRAALTERTSINTAVGVLMAKTKLDRQDATHLLHTGSEQLGVPVAKVAALIVAEHRPEPPAGQPGQGRR